MPYRMLTNKVRRVFFHTILHVDDRPQRIALGAAIGMFVAWTPTVGAQMLLALALATLLCANKAVALPIVWLTNPLTVVPIYWFNYKFGNIFLTGSWTGDPAVRGKIGDLARLTLGMEIFTRSYWSSLLALLVDIGWPLWIGSIITGAFIAVGTYLTINWSIVRYRSARAKPPADDVKTGPAAVGDNQPAQTANPSKHQTAA